MEHTEEIELCNVGRNFLASNEMEPIKATLSDIDKIITSGGSNVFHNALYWANVFHFFPPVPQRKTLYSPSKNSRRAESRATAGTGGHTRFGA